MVVYVSCFEPWVGVGKKGEMVLVYGLPKEESGPKVVFGDNSLGDIEGYSSVDYNGITFTMGTIFNQNDEVVLIAPRRRDVYVIDITSYNKESNTCFFVKASPSVNWLWHKRLSHLNFKNINNLAKLNLISGLPSLTFSKDKNFSACEKGKHHRASLNTKRSFSINKCLHLLYMDLFGPVKPQTISHNKYTLVIVDEYSRYTWVFCLKKKSDAADFIMYFIKKMEKLNEVKVKELRSDNGTEFRNYKLEEFYDEKGISQNFSSPCTPEQNGVAERRNRTLIEAAITMLNSAKLPKQFWREAVNTAYYTQNRSIIVKRHGKTAYDVFRGRSPDISYFHVFACPLHIYNHRDHLGKFDEKADDGFFLGYSLVVKAFRVFNIRRQEMEETVHVTFSEDDEAISYPAQKGMQSTSMKIDPSLMMNSLNPGVKLLNALEILSPDESGVFVNETLFRGMIGLLMYLITSRPDIQFPTCLYTSSVAMSSAEAEYIIVAGCCAQVLWIKSQLADYDVLYDKVSIFCDNTSAIAISNNPVLHSRTKHIDIRYHFIRDHILKGDIKLYFVPTDLQLADIFTKPLAESSFTRFVAKLCMLNIEKQVSDKKKALSDPLT
ncbi:retrovirus-related pol polyprotein from transposon TNT 1-94 [Tanacetum coccineum]|uniref:Retrovirus-related pol polyprotein from transposon TNT 1-94 n=1 Tax=Tanacetum coccineum TaxID=301880 RepID=A0ABQ5BIJ2_9ASTR